MKLLFDQNISIRLVRRLRDVYPDASHVSLVGLDRASDEAVWKYAKKENYIIVTKDSDFNDLIVLHGFPPKAVWLQIGNCTNTEIETLLRNHFDIITDFYNNPDTGILTLG